MLTLPIEGVDFEVVQTGFALGPSEDRVAIPFSILEDVEVEGTEGFSLTIVSRGEYEIGAAETVTINIEDNDGKLKWS